MWLEGAKEALVAEINPKVANQVLYAINEGGYPPGSFFEAVIEALQRADQHNLLRLGMAFPEYAAAFALWKLDDGSRSGLLALKKVAAEEYPEPGAPTLFLLEEAMERLDGLLSITPGGQAVAIEVKGAEALRIALQEASDSLVTMAALLQDAKGLLATSTEIRKAQEETLDRLKREKADLLEMQRRDRA